MGKETIELAKNYDPKKSIFPAIAQRKWDGVPVRFMCITPGKCIAVTRQGERITSIDHLIPIAEKAIRDAGGCIIGELIVPGRDFKEVSGLVRRKQASPELICKVFDGDLDNLPKKSYHMRVLEIAPVLMAHGDPRMQFTAGRHVGSVEDVERYFEWLKVYHAEEIEGVMFHDPTKPFQPGKRCWGMGRWKPQPVNTFKVVGFEEAISEAGAPLGMVGRVNILLRRKSLPAGTAEASDLDWEWDVRAKCWQAVVGVGPGKLSHADRKFLWTGQGESIVLHVPFTELAEVYADIKHMPDPSYEALRQPTFQCFRPDKKEGDILEY